MLYARAPVVWLRASEIDDRDFFDRIDLFSKSRSNETGRRLSGLWRMPASRARRTSERRLVQLGKERGGLGSSVQFVQINRTV